MLQHIHMSHSEVSAAQSMLLSVVILLYLLTESMIYNYRMCVKTSTSKFHGTIEPSPGHGALRLVSFRLTSLNKSV